jgi:predicted transcriptional regulator
MNASIAAFDASTELRAARRRARVSQNELATRAGTSQASISDIERGRRQPTVELLNRLLWSCGHVLRVADTGSAALDPDDLMLLRLNMMVSPAERLAQAARVMRLRGLARG